MGGKKSQKKLPKGAGRLVFNRVRVRQHGPGASWESDSYVSEKGEGALICWLRLHSAPLHFLQLDKKLHSLPHGIGTCRAY
jgi:hypothetical protein